MKIKTKLSKNLLPIYEYEKKQHNSVIRIEEELSKDCPLAIVFKEPLKYPKDLRDQLPHLVEYWEDKHPKRPHQAGYRCLETSHKLVAPLPAEIQGVHKRLSKNLVEIYEYELAHGNQVKDVYENPKSSCSLFVTFFRPLKYRPVSQLSLSKVEIWKNTDPHYPIEFGYRCRETGHIVAGPQ